MGDRSFEEALNDIQRSLQFLRSAVSSDDQQLSDRFRPELAKVTRRIRLLTYAARRAIDADHAARHSAVRARMRGEGETSGKVYTAEELRARAARNP